MLLEPFRDPFLGLCACAFFISKMVLQRRRLRLHEFLHRGRPFRFELPYAVTSPEPEPKRKVTY